MTLLAFFRGQIQYLKRHGFELVGVSSPGAELEEVAARERIAIAAVLMVRGLSPFSDLVALIRLIRLFFRLQPTIVHGHTPKAALLAMLAAGISRVPVRFYTIRGLSIEIRLGKLRYMMKALEWLTCRLAHQVFAVSSSVRDIIVRERLCPPIKIRVLGQGSSNGVDSRRFNQSLLFAEKIDQFRDQHKLPENKMVIGFIGRIVKEKGIQELISAWNLLKDEFPDLHLLMVGPFETRDAVNPPVAEQIRNDPRIHHIEWLNDVLLAYQVMKVVVLPTYREGFPNVPLEAAAMELPVVATQVTGCVDAVVDGVTGILVPPRDPIALADAIRKLLKDPELRQRMGKAGRERVIRDFKPEDIWEALYQEYVRLLKEKGIPVPPGDVSAFCQ
jgi:glycosyltransferase involved in cell wall biosynthesis